ncbi:ABC transporter substrate-binding protein [Actibacterium pelagium]|uniref:ABC transporter substrate-binding protein n=2 Tax=Actibacterium pelagium TaxID=2029103 RepID=A0A917EN50_9RHOB|nr:ABC transporter substrate-binding protein [Actibacterium pelagium]
MKTQMSGLATNGVLRAAINTGNRALVQVIDGVPLGVSPALARRLADEIGAQLSPVIYDGAGKVFNDAQADVWDVGFLAIDSIRAEKVSFTRPYHTIEATYAVRIGGPVQGVEDVDRAGITVLTSTGSAYDMHLTASLEHAQLQRSGTPTESFAEFRQGNADVVAGVRASLERFFRNDPNVQVLDGVLTKVEQAMVLPGADNPLITALDDFVARAITDGFVASETGA